MRYMYFRLTAKILDFGHAVTYTDYILLSAIALDTLENILVAFGISILTCVQDDIHAFPV